jgi:hypothetical protein
VLSPLWCWLLEKGRRRPLLLKIGTLTIYCTHVHTYTVLGTMNDSEREETTTRGFMITTSGLSLEFMIVGS